MIKSGSDVIILTFFSFINIKLLFKFKMVLLNFYCVLYFVYFGFKGMSIQYILIINDLNGKSKYIFCNYGKKSSVCFTLHLRLFLCFEKKLFEILNEIKNV